MKVEGGGGERGNYQLWDVRSLIELDGAIKVGGGG